MNPFILSGDTTLLTKNGRDFLGLQRTSSPEMAARLRKLFEYLDSKLGFADNPSGRHSQSRFNLLLRYAYPELVIDLADILYVQHERLTVFLNLEHIYINLQNDPHQLAKGISPDKLFSEIENLFQQLVNKLKKDPVLQEDEFIAKLLAESYAYYVHQTGNLPWDMDMEQPPVNGSVLDIASGLAGFSLVRAWEESRSNLILSDSSPFILQMLDLYRILEKKQNIQILKASFPNAEDLAKPVEAVWAGKFLHHLKREERRKFLKWSYRNLIKGGKLTVIDTDLEYRILERSKEIDFTGKLIPGYLETLVDIEGDFCLNLEKDICGAGFQVVRLDSNKYLDETDAYSLYPDDKLKLKFTGVEIVAEKI